jgi:signal transduction histidine kinase
LWIGTEAGLHSYRAGKVTAFTTRSGLFDDLVNSLLEDDEGAFWIGCDRAIYRVEKQELIAVAEGRLAKVRSEPFDEEDGLLSTETNGQKSQPAAWKTRSGRLLFATTHGVAMVDPGTVRSHRPPPPRVVIQQVVADGRVVYGDARLEEGMAAPAPPAPAGGALRLGSQQGRAMEFRYASTSFGDPAHVQFQHRLEGYDDAWREAGDRRSVFYGHLAPGSYRFRVRAANRHNLWNLEGASLAFQVAPAFYQTWTFRWLALLAAAGSGAAFVRWRLSEMRRIQRLELRVAVADERSRIARDLHDGLGADLSQITLLAEVAARHSARQDVVESRLGQLTRVARDAGQALRDLIWVSSPASETLEGVVNRICQRAEEFLSAAGIGYRFDVPLDWPELQLDVAVRQNLRYVARESLNNTVRHGRAHLVRIRARLEGDWFSLTLADDGCGFDAAAVALASGDDPEPSERTDGARGMGLGNMRARMREVGGELAIDSQPGAGTRVQARVPIGGKALQAKVSGAPKTG